jgi:hypothetical protein
MGTTRFIYWKDEDAWLGYLEEYPDYMTQGESLEELKENLRDIYADLVSGAVPCVRRAAELGIGLRARTDRTTRSGGGPGATTACCVI